MINIILAGEGNTEVGRTVFILLAGFRGLHRRISGDAVIGFIEREPPGKAGDIPEGPVRTYSLFLCGYFL